MSGAKAVAVIGENEKDIFNSISYLTVDYSLKSTYELIGELRDAGLWLITTPVIGLPEPELYAGGNRYLGKKEIGEFLKKIK